MRQVHAVALGAVSFLFGTQFLLLIFTKAIAPSMDLVAELAMSGLGAAGCVMAAGSLWAQERTDTAHRDH